VTSTVVIIDGTSLTCAAVTAVARREAGVAVGERAVTAARAAWQTGRDLAARQPVYGRSTGVGANHVVVPLYGAIGTGDLTALASTGLCLLGERAWQGGNGPPPQFGIRTSEALGFINSSAATLGDAALACHDLAALLRAAAPVAALSLLAARGSAEPYAEAVHLARPHPGQQRVAATMRALLAAGEIKAARVQDPYGYRAFPQVHGPALDSVEHAAAVLEAELNGSAENPLIDVAGQAVWHNGNFHAAYVGLALDAIRAALFQTAALSVARLGTLMEPAFTGLNAFLAEDRASSGVMILEYVAHSAVADIRRFAAPAALGGAVLSRGAEEHAGFATQSARATSDAVAAYRAVLACELIAATRALRLQGRPPAPGGALREAFDLADSALEPAAADRPLDSDLSAADAVLPGIAAVASWPA